MSALFPYGVQDAPAKAPEPAPSEPRWKSLLRAGVAGSLASVLGIGLLVGTGTIGDTTNNPDDPISTQPFQLSAHALDGLVGKSWQEAQKVVQTLPSGQQAPTGSAVLAVDHNDTVVAWTTTRDDGTFEFFGLPVAFVTNGTQGRYITVQPADSKD